MLSDKAVREYQLLIKKVYGIEIPYQQAKDEGIKLLHLFQIIYKPIKK